MRPSDLSGLHVTGLYTNCRAVYAYWFRFHQTNEDVTDSPKRAISRLGSGADTRI